MADTLLLLIKLSVGAMILAVGMGATFADVAYLWRRPALLLRSVLAMYVLVPLAAFVLAEFLPLAPGVRVALLVIAVSAGAPLLPRRLRFGGSPYVFSLVVTSSLLAIVLVPAWLAVLSRHFDVAIHVGTADVAAVLARAFLLPLVIGILLGMALRRVVPARTERIADTVFALAAVVLAVATLILIADQWQVFTEVRGPGIVALLALMVISVAIGHALGGPNPDDRTALAIACCTRHIGIVVILAATFRGPRAVVLLAVYLVAASAVSIPYLRWRRRTAPADKP